MPPAPNDPTDSPAPFPVYPVPPDLLAWARPTFDINEYLDGVREIEATGGHSLESVIREIEEQFQAGHHDER